jgi:beta-phosphoglucomutase-like phosphatase (HAD superfamily)
VIATLLDFDGVLVDSEPTHLAAFNEVLATRNLSISEADYMGRFLSLDDAGVFRAVIATRGRTLSEEDVRSLVAAKAARFMALFGETFRAFPGAAELVERRAALGPVGIVSGALEPEITFALGRMGIAASVAFVISAEKVRAPKPDPAPFEAALKELAARGHAGRAVVVEDSPGGVRAAKKAGLRCVAVAHSRGEDELRRAGADAVAKELGALTDALLDGTGS